MPGGVYFARLIARNAGGDVAFTKVNRLMLMK
jgi:hypothetical protein